MHRDWRNPDDFEFTASLSAELWAWQFLRRNPGYQKDYRWFIQTWRSLEADYGKAPDRDFARWKLDDRAYAPESMVTNVCADDRSCASPDGDRLLIECAMGAKWGFYKFPNDPAVEFPEVPGQLIWRELETLLPGYAAHSEAHIMQVSLDLRVSLQQQLQELRNTALAKQQEFRRQSGWNSASLTGYLRLLDADSAGENCLDTLYAGDQIAYKQDRQQAYDLLNGDYRLLVYANLRKAGN